MAGVMVPTSCRCRYAEFVWGQARVTWLSGHRRHFEWRERHRR